MMLKTRKIQRNRSTVDLSSVMGAIGKAEWKYDSQVTKAMVIERTAKETGKRDVITFSQAYGELSMWLDKAFANISESGLSDMLAAEFFQGAAFHTNRAEYKFWNRQQLQAQQ